uniref:Uncharacterized protein n=1 Tax=Setaria italica TaxID=4555 RepID=K3ZA64_SETIT
MDARYRDVPYLCRLCLVVPMSTGASEWDVHCDCRVVDLQLQSAVPVPRHRTVVLRVACSVGCRAAGAPPEEVAYGRVRAAGARPGSGGRREPVSSRLGTPGWPAGRRTGGRRCGRGVTNGSAAAPLGPESRDWLSIDARGRTSYEPPSLLLNERYEGSTPRDRKNQGNSRTTQ